MISFINNQWINEQGKLEFPKEGSIIDVEASESNWQNNLPRGFHIVPIPGETNIVKIQKSAQTTPIHMKGFSAPKRKERKFR